MLNKNDKKLSAVRSLLILIFSIASITNISCTSREDYFERQKNTQIKFEESISEESKSLIQKFLNDNLEIKKGFKKIDKPFYCLWKEKDIKIYPHLSLNERFEKDGYPITLSEDSLNYLIISENVSHRVGTYSNGAKAAKLETIISIIDLREQKAYQLKNHMGGSPPNSTSNSSVALGSHWGDENIYNYLTKNRIAL